MEEHYLFLNSSLSKNLHPSNTPLDFTVELPHSYELNGQWACGLKEIQLSVRENIVYVCSDICEESYAENTMIPILRTLHKPEGNSSLAYFHFDDPMYVKLKAKVMNRVRIFIRDTQLKGANATDSTVHCTLHLRKWK